MKFKASQSEDSGINLLTDDDLQVLSIGISSGGVAEIRMANLNSNRKIIATTIDQKGIDSAKKFIEEQKVQDQIEVRLEDVSSKLPYSDSFFDFIYARLVLHYLSKDKLQSTLKELHRILKPSGKLYIVVRSINCDDAKRDTAVCDPETGLTSGTIFNEKDGTTYKYSRFFHTEESISKYVTEAGFKINYVKSYDENLYIDFMRTKMANNTDNVIELQSEKI